MLEEEKVAGKKRSYDEKGNVLSTTSSASSQGSPGANLEKNRAKRAKKAERKKAATVGSPKPNQPQPNPPASNTRSKTQHCINNFASQLKVGNGFHNGMPDESKVRECNPLNGACTFIHTVVDHTPGSLDKGIADELIKATANFGNASFKSNFVRIVKFLKAT